MSAGVAPDEGMALRIPIGCSAVGRLGDRILTLEPPACQCKAAQDRPPRLDQAEISGILGLEHHLPARMGEPKQQHVRGAMRTQVIHDRVDQLGRARYPGLNVPKKSTQCAPRPK